MGFLKFLKKPDAREKDFASGDNELEIPPPPEISSLSSELPSFAGPRLESPSIPPLRPLDASSTSGYRQKPVEFQLLEKLPELKPFGYYGQEKKEPALPVAVPEPVLQQAVERMPERISAMPWDSLKHPTISAPPTLMPRPAAHDALNASQFEPAFAREGRTPFVEKAAEIEAQGFDRPVFISSSMFRQIIEDLDAVMEKKALGSGLDGAREAEEREYGKLGSCLEDMQRKLMFVDKSLFEV
ncbi:hypothetical protein HYU15_02695 [Candidatus Woesearchaeota archaeon]|nr:hypothetical protein [Candidatus Woesearchaeota archaeon]